MADVKKLAPFIFSWEGGYVNDPLDLGGETNMGVTIGTWKQVGKDLNGDGLINGEDLKLLDKDLIVDCVLKPHYWDRWKADQINSQAVANILVDWVWASGTHGIKRPQRILGVAPDGVVGPKTIMAVNAANAAKLFEAIKADRLKFIDEIVAARPANKRFEKGWKNRINSIKYE